MGITIIAAVARNGVIGNSKLKDGKMPWHIPEELRFFREETMGKVVVMGRKTAESVGYLKGRHCAVMSTRPGYELDGFKTLGYNDVMNLALSKEVMICGGAEIYQLFMNDASKITISELDISAPGDILMPPISRTRFMMSGTKEYDRFTVVRRVRCDTQNK